MERIITSLVILCFGIGLPIAHAIGDVGPFTYAFFTPGIIFLAIGVTMYERPDYGFSEFLCVANRAVLMVSTVVYVVLMTHYMRNSMLFTNGEEIRRVAPWDFGPYFVAVLLLAMFGVITFGLGKLLRNELRRKPVNMFAAL